VVSANVNAHLTAVGRVRGADKEWKRFVSFVHEHKRAYRSVAEVNAKFDIFRENMVVAAAHQARNPKARFGPTKFSDITQADFETLYLMSRDASNDMINFMNEKRRAGKHVHTPKNVTAGNVDWCAQGQCTPIKDQGRCGSCWAFSATETFESMLMAGGKVLPDGGLAPQQVVSCDTNGQDQGCGGGMPAGAIQYLNGAGGQCAEGAYKYVSGEDGETGQCNMQGNTCPDGSQPLFTPSGSMDVGQSDDALQSAISSSVVSVGVDASSWNSYQGGVMTDCGSQLDHAVVATGMATDQGGYYIVRNSWSQTWGENGFIFLAFGNTCGIANNAITVQT
jgi:cysteine peptidase B